MAQVSDTDRDGIPNITDPFPTVNAVVADPDGNNNLSPGLQTGLIGRWDFESLTVSGSYHRFVDLAGGDQPLDCRQLSMGIDNAGMISKGALFDAGNDHLTAPGTLFHNRAAFTTSMWFKFPPGYVQNKPNNIHTVFFVCNNSLDVYPELIVSIYKGIYGSTTQKIAVSRYDGTNIVVAYYGEIPIADHLDDGYWHHLAYVKNGTNSRLFVNGVKIKEANLMNSTLTSTTSGYICYGKSVPVATNQGHTFQGSMDRLRFYSRNLSETEVAELYRQDSDRDGHWDIVEKEWAGAFPMSPFYAQNPEFDTDRDGLPDNWERLHSLDPLSAVGVNGATGDSDNDGVTNIDEFQNNTNPSMNNTDGDGATDAVEIAQGSDPNNAADSGLPPIDPLESVTFRTGGDYATWRMNITGQGPRDFRELVVTAPNFNEFKTQIHKLHKNNSYRITLRHIASRPDLTDNWYCWEAQINGFPSTASFATTAANTLGTRTTEGMATIINNHWIADNSQGLLTTHLDSKNIDRATALTAYLRPVEVVDKNGASLSELKVAKMYPDVISGTGLSGGPVNVNLDKDEDRFFVRIKGSASLGTIKIKFETLDNADVMYNDDQTEYTLESKDGYSTTKAMVLVSDDVDDNHLFSTGGAPDNSPDDQTHLIQLGGNFKVSAIKFGEESWMPVDVKLPVKKKKTVRVQFVNCTYGVINIDPCWDPALIAWVQKKMQQRYAQVGIDLDFPAVLVGPLVSLGGSLDDNEIFSLPSGTGKMVFPQESKDLVDHGPPNDFTNTLMIYLVNGLDSFRGVASPAKYVDTADNRFKNKVFLARYDFKDFTASHEALHVLSDAAHDIPPYVDFTTEFSNMHTIWTVPSGPEAERRDNGSIGSTKRISHPQEVKIQSSMLAH